MAESVNKTARQLLQYCGFLLLASSFAVVATADNLPDPTRPPASLAKGGIAVISSGPILQSVLIASGRRVAVISGQTMQVGDNLGELRLTKITETEVVLSNGKDAQTLKLFPGIEKWRSAGRAAVKANNRPQ